MARAGVHKGIIKQIGAGITLGSMTESSVIEIGDDVVEKVWYGSYISTYLDKALQSQAPVAIAICEGVRHDNMNPVTEIIAIKMNGKIYQPEGGVANYGMGREFGAILVPGCVFAIATFGLGLIPILWLSKARADKTKNAAKRLLSELERTAV